MELVTLAEAGKESGPFSLRPLKKQIQAGRLLGEKRNRDWVVSRQALLTYLENRAPVEGDLMATHERKGAKRVLWAGGWPTGAMGRRAPGASRRGGGGVTNVILASA